MVLTRAMTTIVVSGEKRSGKTVVGQMLCAVAGGSPILFDCSSKVGCTEARATVPDAGAVVFDNVHPGWVDALIAVGRERAGLTIVTTDDIGRLFDGVAAHFHMRGGVVRDGADAHIWVSPGVRS